MSKAKKTKGKRYTIAEKQEVLNYVSEVDSERGRGGVAAAARKYGITPLTISAWKKKLGTETSTSSSAGRGSTAQARVLHRLAEILDEIEDKKSQVAALEKEYAKLKKKV